MGANVSTDLSATLTEFAHNDDNITNNQKPTVYLDDSLRKETILIPEDIEDIHIQSDILPIVADTNDVTNNHISSSKSETTPSISKYIVLVELIFYSPYGCSSFRSNSSGRFYTF